MIKIIFNKKFLLLNFNFKRYFSPLNIFKRKGKNPDPDPDPHYAPRIGNRISLRKNSAE